MILTIPGTLPGLNEMTNAARGNKFKAASQKKIFTELIAYLAKSAKLPQMDRIALDITWLEPNRKRDPDNIMAGAKYILDGLVLAGVIPNDGQKNIESISHTVRLDKTEPRVEIDIREAAHD